MKVCTNKDCAKKGKKQPKENFYKHSGFKDGLQNQCKKCQDGRRTKSQKQDWLKYIIG